MIKEEEATWNHEALEEVFDYVTKNRVLSILVAGVEMVDSKMWREDNTGIYSAKSDYKWLMNKEVENLTLTSQLASFTEFYNKLWNLHLASKIKITFWLLLTILSLLSTIYKIGI